MIGSVIRGDKLMFLHYNLYFLAGLVYVIMANVLGYHKFILKVVE